MKHAKRKSSRSVVALLRGVNNIGSAKRIAMAELRKLFERLGFHDVRTVGLSGNVVFSVPGNRRGDLARRIERALDAKFGVKPRVMLLSRNEIMAAVRDHPFAKVADDPSRLLVLAPSKRADLRRLEPVLERSWHPEALARGNRLAWLWCANSVAESTLWPAVDRALGRTGTVRNMATMRRLLSALAAHRRGGEHPRDPRSPNEPTMKRDPIAAYSARLPARNKAVCALLRKEIDSALPDAVSKVWHGAPVWFVGETPVAGYSKTAKGDVSLLFWNGQAFEDPALRPIGKFQAAEARFEDAKQIDAKSLRRWLKQAGTKLWDWSEIRRKLAAR